MKRYTSYSDLAPLMAGLPESQMSVMNEGLSSRRLLAMGNPPARVQTSPPKGARIARLGRGMGALEPVSSAPSLTSYDCQFVNCQTAVLLRGAAAHLRNALFFNDLTDFDIATAALDVQNATFDTASYLVAGSSGATALFTNCVLAGVSHLTTGYPTPTGSYNAFYNTTTFGSSAFTSSSSPLQAVGAASCYLTDGSTFRGVGTTAIDSALLAELGAKTTYPPIVYYSAGGDILTSDLYLSPRAPRDTASAPDLSFHYDPIDYAFGHVWLTNATISVAPGTAIGTFATSAGWYGLALAQGSRFYCQGAPTDPVHVVRYNMVQEHSTTAWDAVGPSVMGAWYAGIPAQAAFRFTDWSMPAQDSYDFETDGEPMGPASK